MCDSFYHFTHFLRKTPPFYGFWTRILDISGNFSEIFFKKTEERLKEILQESGEII